MVRLGILQQSKCSIPAFPFLTTGAWTADSSTAPSTGAAGIELWEDGKERRRWRGGGNRGSGSGLENWKLSIGLPSPALELLSLKSSSKNTNASSSLLRKVIKDICKSGAAPSVEVNWFSTFLAESLWVISSPFFSKKFSFKREKQIPLLCLIHLLSASSCSKRIFSCCSS